MKTVGSTHVCVVRDTRAERSLGNLMGVLSEDQIDHALSLHPHPKRLSLSDLLLGSVVPLSAGCSLKEALRLSTASHHHVFPVVEGDTLVGLVTDKDLLEALQGRLSGLRNVAKQFEDLARHDALTGLANRRYFDSALEQEAARHARIGPGLGLLLVDIDHFKSINDRFGHPRGDLVLQEVATRLRHAVRSTDLVARIGGEEFAILAALSSREALLGLAEKVRWCIARDQFRAPERTSDAHTDCDFADERPDHEPQVDLTVTISVGAALLEGKLDSPRRLVRAADEALYGAKRDGRNQVRLGQYQPSTADLPAIQVVPTR